MLSCLQRQAVLLEKELKDVRKKAVKAEAAVADRDATIEALRARLAELENPPEPEPEPEPAPEEPAPVTDGEKEALQARLGELQELLSGQGRELTMAQLRISVLELQKLTGDPEWRKLSQEWRAKYESSCVEIRGMVSANGELASELQCLREGLLRRDEQIEFLMQVHDATAEVEWSAPWECPACTLRNSPSEDHCTACGGARPSGATARAADSGASRPWSCPHCTFENLDGSAVVCAACGRPRADGT